MKPKILLVDDEVALVDALREFFTGRGYDVTTAHDGDEALRLLTTGQPEVMVLDLLAQLLDPRLSLRPVHGCFLPFQRGAPHS